MAFAKEDYQPKNQGEIRMARAKHYSPHISRFLVSVLFHEAQRRKIPMTKLTNELIRQQLSGSESWQKAQELKVAEDSPNFGVKN